MDTFTKQDPYVVITFGNKTAKTSVLNGAGTQGSWEETFPFIIDTADIQKTEIDLKVMDEDVFSSDEVGRATLFIPEITQVLGQRLTVQLKNKENTEVRGEVIVTVELTGLPSNFQLPKAEIDEGKDQKSSEWRRQEGEALPGGFVLEEKDEEIGLPQLRKPGKLYIQCHRAILNRGSDFITKSDPYAILQVGKQKYSTHVASGQGKTPSWEKKFTFNLKGTEDVLKVTVKDKDTLIDDNMGSNSYRIDDILSKPKHYKYQLLRSADSRVLAGVIVMSVSFVPTELVSTEFWGSVDGTNNPGIVALPMGETPLIDEDLDYEWDWALCFSLGVAHETIKLKKKKWEQPDFFRLVAGEMVLRLLMSGLKVMLYKAQSNDKVICLIGASEKRLKHEAQRIEHSLELDRDECLSQGRGRLGLVEMTEEEKRLSPDDWFNIYAPFKDSNKDMPDRERLFRHYNLPGRKKPSIFRNLDRLKLIMSIVESPIAMGGCEMQLSRFKRKANHPLKDYFPLHKHDLKEEIFQAWSRTFAVFSQPLKKIRNYYGEKVAFYFAFLQFYSRWLVLPALFGIIIAIYQLIDGRIDGILLPLHGLLVALWAAFFLEFWKRRQATLGALWGVTDFHETEQTRPEYKGELKKSVVDASVEKQYPFWRRLFRLLLGNSVVFVLIGAVLASVFGIVFFRALAIKELGKRGGGIVASIVSSIQIILFNLLYTRLARRINDFENHRTESEYENALIAKTFIFKFINSYNTLFYIAFFKQHDLGYQSESCVRNCMVELRTQLAIIFFLTLFYNNFMEFSKPFWRTHFKESRLFGGMDEEDKRDLSPAEVELALDPYETTFDEFDELVIQFGYGTLFVTAFPIAPLLAVIACMIEIKLDSSKLLKFSRRPIPRRACNIGTWFNVFDVLGFIAIVTNLAVVVFSVNPGETESLHYDMTGRFLFFIIAEHAIMGLKYLIDYLIADVPMRVKTRIMRQEHVTRILVNGMHEQDYGDDMADEYQQREESGESIFLKTELLHSIYDPDRIPQRVPRQLLASFATKAKLKMDGSNPVVKASPGRIVSEPGVAAAAVLKSEAKRVESTQTFNSPGNQIPDAGDTPRGSLIQEPSLLPRSSSNGDVFADA
eukprot:g19562.t1